MSLANAKPKRYQKIRHCAVPAILSPRNFFPRRKKAVHSVKTVPRVASAVLRRPLTAKKSTPRHISAYIPTRKMSNQTLSAQSNEDGQRNRNSTVSESPNSPSQFAGPKTVFSWRRPLPSFVAPSSRGSVPHLIPDNFHSHTNIPSVQVALEDFITSPPHNSPVFSIGIPLQKYLAYPEHTVMLFSARRANPLPINASWNDKIEIQTVDGRSPLPIDLFISAVHQLHLRQEDIVISVPDITETPGTKRLAKMVARTQSWLDTLLKLNVPGLNSRMSL